MTQLSDNFMLEMLSKIQPFLIDILKTGRSSHLDCHYHEHMWTDPDHSIDFEVFVFEGHEIVESFEFNSLKTKEQIEATFASMAAYVHSL